MKSLHSEGNHQINEKATYQMGKSILCEDIYKPAPKKKKKKKRQSNLIKKWAENQNRHFPKDIEMAIRHIKRWTSLIIREIPIKTTLRYHLTPVRLAKNNNSGNDRSWWGCGERGTLLHCWWECKLLQPLWKTVWRLLKKLKIESPYNNNTIRNLSKGYKSADL